MTIPYKVKSIKDDIVIGIIGEDEKEFKLDVVEDELSVGDYFLAQNGYVLQQIPNEDAENLLQLFS
jgi:hydrogenase maturation factor